MNKFKYEDVKKFVEENSECILISNEYKNNSSPLKMYCGCGDEFSVSFAKFKDRNKRQCNNCSNLQRRKNYSFTIEYVKKFVEENSNCTLISKEYINNSEKLDFICECGNKFSTSFAKFKDRNQKQCYECGIDIRTDSHKFDLKQVKNIIELKKCKLLSDEYVNARTSIHIECECGKDFYTTLEVFQRGKNRCDNCSFNISKLEKIIEEYLIKCQIKYSKEYRFVDCRNEKPLPFDFAVFNRDGSINALIEADGIQHFEPVELFGGEKVFLEQKERDSIKNNYCSNNNIKLIRIPYYEQNNIYKILNKHFSKTIPSQS